MIITCQWTRLHNLIALRFDKIALFPGSSSEWQSQGTREEPESKVIDELKSTKHHGDLKLTVRVALQMVNAPQW